MSVTDPLEGLEGEPDVMEWHGNASAYKCEWGGWDEPGPYWLDVETILAILRTGMHPGFKKLGRAA